MPDAPTPSPEVTQSVGRGLGHKLGPLPIWGWILVGGGVIVVGYLAYSAYSSAQQGGTATPSLPDLGSFLGGSGTPAGTPTTTTTTTTPLTNADWLNTVVSQVASATQLPVNEVQLYLDEYLNGNSPIGIPGGSSQFQNVINSALSIGGTPPQGAPLPSLNTNYFTSNQAYLGELLTFLPSGTSSSVQQEITNLLNGSTTVISQDAANALAYAQSIVGQGPNALTYTIGSTTVTPPGGASLTQTLIDAWDNAYLSLPVSAQTFANWTANAPALVTQSVDTGTLQQIYAYFNSAAGQAAVKAQGGPLNWWNNYLAHPFTIPSTQTAPTLNSAPSRS